MTSRRLPDRLQRAVEQDSKPVRPLHPAWMKALLAVAVTAIVLAATLATASLRTDIGQLPMWLTWGSSLVQLALGLLLIGLALRESIPGESLARGAVGLAAAAALAVQILIGVATSVYAASGTPCGNGMGMTCFSHEAAMALPTFAITLILVFRALPLRAPTAGLLGGAGATLAADAVIHLLCPVSNLMHVLTWHTGSIVFFMGLGWTTGFIWRRIHWGKGS